MIMAVALSTPMSYISILYKLSVLIRFFKTNKTLKILKIVSGGAAEHIIILLSQTRTYIFILIIYG